MKKIAIGTSDFKKLIDEDAYYIDKSLFIKDIIDDGSDVMLFPRPRRFGKTLNMSMLRYFFEKTDTDNSYLFNNLKISQFIDIMHMQGSFPVIYLTFKDVHETNFEDAIEKIKDLISSKYDSFKYILDSEHISEVEKLYYNGILYKKSNQLDLEVSIKKLSKMLSAYFQTKVIILIDEYDAPIQEGYLHGYYEQIVKFIRNLLSAALKDNEYLKKSVLTGILRLAKESVFSGLNNLDVCTMMSDDFSEYFGFTEKEVKQILADYQIQHQLQEVSHWYNGYQFGDKTIYNPWSILKYVKSHKDGFKPYWVNTSSNDLVKEIITKGSSDVKKELEDLINKKELTKTISEDLVIRDIDKDNDSVWSFLLFSGYLKITNKELKNGKLICKLKIPNAEVHYLYEEIILSWFKESLTNEKFKIMLESLLSGEIEIFEDIFSEYVTQSLSFFDIGNNSESVYHAFVLGMLVSLSQDYEIKIQ